MRALRPVLFLLALSMLGVLGPGGLAGPASAATSLTGTFHPADPARLLDTRTGLGAPRQPLGAGATLKVQVAGRAGVPTSGVAAVVINLTATAATAGSWLTLYPSGGSRPNVSTLNSGPGRTTANTATVPVGSDGTVSVYNAAGTVQLFADLQGWYASSSTAAGATDYLAQEPVRVLDTRTDLDDQLPGRTLITTGIDFGTDADNRDVRALAVTITVVRPRAGGYLTAWNGVGSRPNVSAVNFQAGVPVANTALVRVRACGSDCDRSTSPVFDVFNGSSAAADVLVDVFGVYVDSASADEAALRFRPVRPVRITDTRGGQPLTSNSTRTFTAPRSVAGSSTATLVTNVTAVAPTAGTYLIVWPTGDRPGVSNLNTPPGRSVADGVNVDLAADYRYRVFNRYGSTHLLVDVSGAFDFAPYASAQRVGGARSARPAVAHPVATLAR